ncbi:MAG: hypothetical protein RIM23_17365 [Coleofasciculus sp. G3-WIS-01]|uniref:hypothetical protein n=1 Tax=Coleofasciculus sp. G3-WIS-01 TaxID=3069528 RepID=UPI0032F76FE0
MYIYRTCEFNEKAERYGIGDRIDDLCTQLQTQRLDEVQSRFERVYPYLKRRILNRRLIGRILHLDNQQLLCFIDIFKRGDHDYEQFLEAPIHYGQTHWEPQLDRQQIRDWLTQAQSEQPSVEPLPELPETLRPWLEPPRWEPDIVPDDWMIYESEEWVRQFTTVKLQQAWKTYYQIISQINTHTATSIGNSNSHSGVIQTDSFADTLIISPDQPQLPENVNLWGENNCYVLYSQIETTDGSVRGVLFLIAAFDHPPSSAEIREVGQRTTLFNGENRSNRLSQPQTIHELTPFARRSYPAYLLADEESWLAIERGREANLALSPEEEEILQSVSGATPQTDSLPLFINGRAGSGKSTMLIYLFADYCYRKHYTPQGHRRLEPLPGQPLFLTYNERLLEIARDGVNRLLRSHHRFVAERSPGDDIPNCDRAFQPFGKFLLSLLPPQERKRFNPDHYISFHRFKQLYQGTHPEPALAKLILHLPESRHYSPEICWHIIRSFIKGYGQSDYMTPEDYQEEVPRKERTIDVEKFQGIYETIWQHWYKHLTTELDYWDDQDLIARVLELKCYHPDYTAIFCDEAQDFTRLELQLIMRLSLFSQYHLGYQPILSLPFAFAGDPFQTLNPTGFHWSSTQAAFNAEVITALDPADQLKLTVNFQDLSYNYRSSLSIVQFTNLIQLWRHVLFDIRELQPQTPWHPGNFPEPQTFILNQTISAEELIPYIKDTIIIVPCEEGEELAYAQADEVLSQIFPQLNDQEPGTGDEFVGAKHSRPNPSVFYSHLNANASPNPHEFVEAKHSRPNPQSPITNPQSPEPLKNVLSAISAKGLEFKRVILYKFGEECSDNVWNLQGVDQKVKVEYFFNKLYVAASRATDYLFIVDSETGNRQLWNYASDEALLQAMLGHAKHKSRWQDKVKTLAPGMPNMVETMRENDPGAIAQEFQLKGLHAENPSLLRRAKQFYRDLGDITQANSCQAWALKFERQYRDAGHCFLELGESDQAWDCFWQGLCWSELVAWYDSHPQDQSAAEGILARFMVTPADDLAALDSFTRYIISHESSVIQGNQQVNQQKQWQQGIKEYARRIETIPNDSSIPSSQWQQFGEVLAILASGGYPELNVQAGTCFYRAQNYHQAIQYWQESNATQTPDYHRAKAFAVGMPEGLVYLAQAGEADQIITQWRQAGKPRDRRWLRYVAQGLEMKQEYQQACVVYVGLDDLAKVKDCFRLASQDGIKIKLLRLLFRYFFRQKYWQDALELFNTDLPNVIGSTEEKAALNFDIVYELAGSGLIPQNLSKDQRQQYEQFMEERVLSTPDWQEYLLMPQIGIALEKVGLMVETLSFYEEFVNDTNQQQRQFARERWIGTKKKQVDYVTNQGKLRKAVKLQSNLIKKAQQWAMNPDAISVVPPLAPRERPLRDKGANSKPSQGGFCTNVTINNEKQVPKPAPTHSTLYQSPKTEQLTITGLPPEIRVEEFEKGVIGFTVRHLAIKVMKSTHQVLVTDILSHRDVRVDWTKCQVNLGDATVEAGGSQQLSFTLVASGYRGVLFCNQPEPRLELEIQGCQDRIAICL